MRPDSRGPGENSRVLRTLPRVVESPPGKPVRPGVESAQARSRGLVLDPATWTGAERSRTVDVYRDLARSWNEERGSYRADPMRDALRRGGELPPGLCAEVASGTGLLTPLLTEVWESVVSLDVSWDMLARSRHPWRVRADAAQLPLPDHSAAAVVLADAPLFVNEVLRVLRPEGVVVWSNALGTTAPHYVPPDDVATALAEADRSRRWDGHTSEAGWGVWAVLRSTRWHR